MCSLKESWSTGEKKTCPAQPTCDEVAKLTGKETGKECPMEPSGSYEYKPTETCEGGAEFCDFDRFCCQHQCAQFSDKDSCESSNQKCSWVISESCRNKENTSTCNVTFKNATFNDRIEADEGYWGGYIDPYPIVSIDFLSQDTWKTKSFVQGKVAKEGGREPDCTKEEFSPNDPIVIAFDGSKIRLFIGIVNENKDDDKTENDDFLGAGTIYLTNVTGIQNVTVKLFSHPETHPEKVGTVALTIECLNKE